MMRSRLVAKYLTSPVASLIAATSVKAWPPAHTEYQHARHTRSLVVARPTGAPER